VVPSAPSAGGTVPAWTTLSANAGTVATNGAVTPNTYSSLAQRVAYTVATSNNHTSGTWTNAARIEVMVIRNSGGVGAYAERGYGRGNTAIGINGSGQAPASIFNFYAPALTLRKQDGTSKVLHLWNFLTNFTSATPLTATTKFLTPTGYTPLEPLPANSSKLVFALDKDTTATAPQVDAYARVENCTGAAIVSRMCSIEILAAN
jgi:hypothetical protein